MDRILCNTVFGIFYNELCEKSAPDKEPALSHVQKFKIGSDARHQLSFPEGHGIDGIHLGLPMTDPAGYSAGVKMILVLILYADLQMEKSITATLMHHTISEHDISYEKY